MDFFTSFSIETRIFLLVLLIFLGVVSAAAVVGSRNRQKEEKERLKRGVFEGLRRCDYVLRGSLALNTEEEVLTVSTPQTSFQLRYAQTGNACWLYVYDDMGQRHIVQPDDFRRYVEEFENWHRRVQREAGFPTQQAS